MEPWRSRFVFWSGDGQFGSNQLIFWISTDKRACGGWSAKGSYVFLARRQTIPLVVFFSHPPELSGRCGFGGMQFREQFAGRVHLGPEQRA